MIETKGKYLKDYKDLPMLGKLKYHLSKGSKPVKDLQITFLGATRTVTGSKYLVECGKTKVMVDCGLFQGGRELSERNWNTLPIHPASIDAIILTHAHLDHTGYIPCLIKNGFKGKIYCTPATFDLCKIILPDSGFLQEEDAKYAKKKKYSVHRDPKPLYTQKDAIASFKFFRVIDYYEEITVGDIAFKISRAGHILGSGSIFVKAAGKTILFSGDLGRPESPIIHSPDKVPQVDYVVVESTYGNRLHTNEKSEDKLEDIINKTVAKGGKIIIPAFAVGRTQKILYYIHQLKKHGKIPNVTVFLDSPMSIKVTSLVDDYEDEEKMTKDEYQEIYDTAKLCVTRQQSKNIFNFSGPAIIVSASGMATGGRVLHHIANYAPKPNCTILFTGYQAEGTKGRELLNGKKTVKIHGIMVNVRAKIEELANMSDHSDYKEILQWLSKMSQKPKKVFITHGEPEGSQSLAAKIEQELGWTTDIPEYLETIKLTLDN